MDGINQEKIYDLEIRNLSLSSYDCFQSLLNCEYYIIKGGASRLPCQLKQEFEYHDLSSFELKRISCNSCIACSNYEMTGYTSQSFSNDGIKKLIRSKKIQIGRAHV